MRATGCISIVDLGSACRWRTRRTLQPYRQCLDSWITEKQRFCNAMAALQHFRLPQSSDGSVIPLTTVSNRGGQEGERGPRIRAAGLPISVTAVAPGSTAHLIVRCCSFGVPPSLASSDWLATGSVSKPERYLGYVNWEPGATVLTRLSRPVLNPIFKDHGRRSCLIREAFISLLPACFLRWSSLRRGQRTGAFT